LNWISAATGRILRLSKQLKLLSEGTNMVSAISRILSFDRLLSGLLFLVSMRRQRRARQSMADLPDDLAADVGLENVRQPLDPRADIWRRRGGLGDYLRPGPF
jgi:hypothetical protein